MGRQDCSGVAEMHERQITTRAAIALGAAVAAFLAGSTPAGAVVVSTINNVGAITLDGIPNANYAVQNGTPNGTKTITFNITLLKPVSGFDVEIQETADTSPNTTGFDITGTNPAPASVTAQGAHDVWHLTSFANFLAAGTYNALFTVTGFDGQLHGNDFNMKFSGSVAAVPLPAAGLLFGTALAGLGWFGRRRAALGTHLAGLGYAPSS
jgi:hypothetical protein